MSGCGLHRKGKRKARKHRPQNTVMDRLEQSRKDKKKGITIVEPEGAGYPVRIKKISVEKRILTEQKFYDVKPKEKKGFFRRIFNRKTGG